VSPLVYWILIVMGAVLFSLWWNLSLLPRLFKHPPPKGFHMDTDETDSPSAQRVGGPIYRASDLPEASRAAPRDFKPTVARADEPIERSVNDVMNMRQGCEALARLTKQWEQGATPPWSLVTVDLTEPEHAAYSSFAFDICLWTWALQKLMIPISAAADQRANSALGNLYYVDVSANKLFCADQETMHAVHKALNADYFRLVQPYREKYVSSLKAAARSPQALSEPQRKAVQVLKCGQTLVYVPAADTQLLADLNASYVQNSRPILDAILAEIEAWADRG
jgi:hypothetical protein